MSSHTPEAFTSEEQKLLNPYFSNVDRPVFALVNLPEVVKGALFARYSRSTKSLRRLFLDEFLEETDASTLPQARQVGVGRAERLYERVLTDFGDDSVAQLGGVHLACEGVSNVLTKLLEWGRLMAYLEQSTRYVPYTDQVGGAWKYQLPVELESPHLRQRYCSVLDNAFATYARLLAPLQKFYLHKHPKAQSDSEQVYRTTIRSKALDTLRGLLPAATKSNLGIYGTAQSYENLLLRLRATPLSEAREYADLILAELNNVIPAFMKRITRPERGGKWSAYLAENRRRTAEIATRLLDPIEPETVSDVVLTDFDPEGEIKVVAAALYSVSHLPDQQLLRHVRNMSVADRIAILSSYIGDRTNRRHKPGRAFERTSYRFDILADYGAFRDLQRHRLLTIEWQPLTCNHGYDIPNDITELGVAEDWRTVMSDSASLFEELTTSHSAEVAQYVVPMAYRIRFYMDMNAREAMHLIELRTSPQGHPSYRSVCQKMHLLIAERANHRALAETMRFANHEPVELERLGSERASEQRRQTLGNKTE
jgi:thymidylate synthase ThyX